MYIVTKTFIMIVTRLTSFKTFYVLTLEQLSHMATSLYPLFFYRFIYFFLFSYFCESTYSFNFVGILHSKSGKYGHHLTSRFILSEFILFV